MVQRPLSIPFIVVVTSGQSVATWGCNCGWANYDDDYSGYDSSYGLPPETSATTELPTTGPVMTTFVDSTASADGSSSTSDATTGTSTATTGATDATTTTDATSSTETTTTTGTTETTGATTTTTDTGDTDAATSTGTK